MKFFSKFFFSSSSLIFLFVVVFLNNEVHAIRPETKNAIDRSGCGNHKTFLNSRRTRQMWTNEAITGPYALLHRSPRESDFFNRVLLKCGCRKADKESEEVFHEDDDDSDDDERKEQHEDEIFEEEETIWCQDFLPAWFAYIRRYQDIMQEEGNASKQSHPILIVRNDWQNLGFGHMANVAAGWMMFGLYSGRAVFFDNAESKWDFTEYFEGYLGDGTNGGMSFKWTEELQEKYFPGVALSEETSSTVYEKYEEGNGEEIDYFARFNLWRTSDANKYTKCQYGPDQDVDVGTCFHGEDGDKCRYGEFLEEPCLTEKEMRYECPFGSREAFGCPSCNKCIIHAFKTKHVILWDSSSGSGGALPIERRSADVMTQKNLPPEIVFSDELREALMETAEKRFGWTHAKSFGSYHHQSLGKEEGMVPLQAFEQCLPCAMNLLLRPKMDLLAWKHLLRSDVAFANRLVGLRARTGYAEDKICFPEDMPPMAECIDETFFNETCSSVELQKWHIRLRATTYKGLPGENERILKPSEAVEFIKNRLDATITPEREYERLYRRGYSLSKRSLERRAKMRNPDDNFMYVVTDAPALQNWLEKQFPSMTRFSPGVGVDPTNDLREDHASDADSRAKIAIDFKVQGWIDVSLTLSPSQYYSAADVQSFDNLRSFGQDKPSGRVVEPPKEMKSKELIGFVSPKELYVKNVEVLRDRIERRKEMCGGEDDAGSLELRKFLPKKSSTEDEREDERR